MDTTDMPRFEAMTTGTLLDRAFRLYANNFALMLGITAAAYVPFYLIMLVMEASLGGRLQSPGGGVSMLLFQLASMILLASNAFSIASGAANHAGNERYLGDDGTITYPLRPGF